MISNSRTNWFGYVVQVLSICLVFALLFQPKANAEPATLEEAIKEGTILLDTRLRFEKVENALFAQDAEGVTFRARFGYQTAPFHGFAFLVEGDLTRHLGVDDFNSTVNGKTLFPVIADPNSTRLNRASITFTGIDKLTLSAGRQRWILDNARFVGNVGFRQNEQTYDSAMLQTTALKDVTLTYVYVWQVNRIFGSKSAVGTLDTNTHLINVAYTGLPIGKLVGYAYLINIDGASAASNQTFGLRLTGDEDIGNGFKVAYAVGFAHQNDYKNNPVSYSLDYFEIEGGLSYQGASAIIGFELLEGNGAQGFQTPLATLHKFQGFADVFLATPGSGIEDLYFVAGYTKGDIPTIGKITTKIWYHNFSPDVSGPDLGEELDFLFAVTPFKKTTVSFKYAHFKGSPILPDVDKFWITLEWAL